MTFEAFSPPTSDLWDSGGGKIDLYPGDKLSTVHFLGEGEFCFALGVTMGDTFEDMGFVFSPILEFEGEGVGRVVKTDETSSSRNT